MNRKLKIALIGRTEILYETAILLGTAGHIITCILTAKEAPEYERGSEDFKMLALKIGAKFEVGPKINSHSEFLKSSNADIGISINYTSIIPQEVIDIFPLGILNAHSGDLPRYRGNACQAWAILNGEKKIGLCVHRMIGEELDSGDIIARDYLPISHYTKVTETWEWMKIRTPELILQSVQQLALNPRYVLEHQSKDPREALRCYPRRPEDGKIDWKQSAIQILRLVNASNKPYSGAFCDYEGKRMRIWDAELVEDGEVYCAVPGQVTAIFNNFIEVACGAGKLKIYKVQLDDGDECTPSRHITSIRKRLT